MARDRYTKQSLGVLSQKIAQSRVLLVGAGGIGCELLKNLVLSNFGEIHIIDLDTIDLSNLNRQFLFRHEHIKKSKAIVAKEVAQRFNPNVKLVAHHANIKEAQFNIEWFSSFTLVFNALDNLDARRHVNRMCLAADVPLVESGTTGFNGQVQVIIKNKTACYDCSFKETPKTFPVCTIRSTPSQPIHCIVWAKSYLLPELFGVSEDETTELDSAANAENAEEIAKLKEEAEALKRIRGSMGKDDFAENVFNKVFKEDVERLANMEGMWKTRKAPQPLSFAEIKTEENAIESKESKVNVASNDQRAWNKQEASLVFEDSLTRLSRRLQHDTVTHQTAEPKPMIIFDKDDDDTLDFVTAASTLRSIIFGIEPKSKFDTKQMAGNIIPAIATTNAMVASLCVLQAFKVLKGEYDKVKMVFLDRGKVGAGAFDLPNPDCAVCGVVTARLQVDLEKATLGSLVHDILKEKLGYGEEISVVNQAGGVVYDPDMEDNLEKRIADLDIKDNSYIIIKDDDDERPKVDLQLFVENKRVEDEDIKSVVLVQKDGADIEVKLKPKKEDQPETNAEEGGMPIAADKDPVNANGAPTAGSIAKRKREIDDIEVEERVQTKKVHLNTASGQNGAEAIVLDEEEGIIDLDSD